GLALEPLGRQARARDRRSAAERLELGVVDDAGLGIDLDLQLHHVAAFRRAHEPGSNVCVVLWQGADVTRVLVVVDDLVRIRHVLLSVNAWPIASLKDPRLPSPSRTTATSRADAAPPLSISQSRNRLPPPSSTGRGRSGSRSAPGHRPRRAPSIR